MLRLEQLGLVLGKDFDLNTLGAGAMLGSAYFGRFSVPSTPHPIRGTRTNFHLTDMEHRIKVKI